MSARAEQWRVDFPAPGILPAIKKPIRSIHAGGFSTPSVLQHPAQTAVKPDALYLFFCSIEWRKTGDTSAGWELVQALRSQDRRVRGVAAEMLAGTENGRFLARDLRRTRNSLHASTKNEVAFPVEGMLGEDLGMNTPYGLQVAENCSSCKLKRNGWYCALSSDLTSSFSQYSHLTAYPGNAILFVEGQVSRGAFVLCSGKVKLSTTSREGKVLVLKIVQPGEIVGLSAMISGEPYEVTAETVGPCLVNFVEREGLLRLMERSGELGLRSALAVSREFQSAYRDIHDLILVRSSSGKLARLLLSWVSNESASARELRIHAPATHEEMAQRIGASRETVTRLLSDLKKRDLIRLDGTTLVIMNRPALEAMAI